MDRYKLFGTLLYFHYLHEPQRLSLPLPRLRTYEIYVTGLFNLSSQTTPRIYNLFTLVHFYNPFIINQ